MKPSLHLNRPAEPLAATPNAQVLAGYLPTDEYYRVVVLAEPEVTEFDDDLL